MKTSGAGVGSTYRLQLTRNFRFDDAAAVLPYLRELGVSHVYLSPILRAGAESTHGYDVCSQQEIDPKLGGSEGFERLVATAKELGLGILLDVVPNHMRADVSNPWWRDVLEEGERSAYSRYFDIDWDSPAPSLRGRVLIPVLGNDYGTVLEGGELQMQFDEGAFWIAYYPNRFPVSRSSSMRILEEARASMAPESPARMTLNLLLNQGVELQGDKGQFSAQLADLYISCGPFHSALDNTLKRLNGQPGVPHSFDRLNEIITDQKYRLCWWRLGREEINYRRFFDINELVCVNVQHPEVFRAVHPVSSRLIEQGLRLGLRVDHPDGLWDPHEYFERLKGLWGANEQGHYVVAEKILTGREHLPFDWAVSGTTGYDFLNQASSIFVEKQNEAALTNVYKIFTGISDEFERVVFASRLQVLNKSFAGPAAALARQFTELAARSRYGIDFSDEGTRATLAGYIAAFPVYRTYVTESSYRLTLQDRRAVKIAVRECMRRPNVIDRKVLRFLRDIHLLRFPEDFDDDGKAAARRFIMKLQQLTAPLAAKGLEDTAFYVYNRLISLNEVGGDPGLFGSSIGVFHLRNQQRGRRWPDCLLASSTHDTKRGEDARARISVLSEMPSEWALALERWSKCNRAAKTNLKGVSAPSRNDEYFAYQSLIGAWPEDGGSPEFVKRVAQTMLKAIREAKTNTSWTDVNPDYERAMQEFIARILAPEPANAFLPDFVRFQQRVAFFGRLNSLSQVLLKAASPGVPDFYQGAELWDFSMVDPDNRRAVDYARRKELFANLSRQYEASGRDFLEDILQNAGDGRIKLFITWRLLGLRRQLPELFARGSYRSLRVTGRAARHLCVFARRLGGREVIAIAPRLTCILLEAREIFPMGAEVWKETFVHWPRRWEGRRYRELFTESSRTVQVSDSKVGIRVGDILERFPIAVLSSES